ncbi:hypothetical protein TSAR_001141 [Trichomalopsis sarcophagae]|uniref:NOC3-like protein n=1 Tax=Trichomalopsis sarcophagae TaxID=543379 RepID=A0A232EX78_9HYME|nr:hypothetical protein TSAR_001141 [Trichomalopsis sarcophagae]
MEVEKRYERLVNKSRVSKDTEKVRHLLPIKTKEGRLKKRHTSEPDPVDDEQDERTDTVLSEKFADNNVESTVDTPPAKPISTVQLLAYREEKLKYVRYHIGILSSEILENPEHKLSNLSLLLKYMDERNPEVYITVTKLATASILEIFKDLLPSYNIWSFDKSEVKLKKETLLLQNQETALLKYYRQYLQKLEKMASAIKKTKHKQIVKKLDAYLAMFAIDCMSKLLVTQPYFNFSSNIAHFLIPFLDNKHPNVRETVAKCFRQIFKEDLRGELSVSIVRHLNQYVKVHKLSVHLEVIQILLSLRIKDINLDKNKEETSNYKKLVSHKNRVLALSKKERKRKSKLEQIEKELLETKAEENKQSQSKTFTEITSLLFTIYFRILKNAPSGKILSSCLEGLSKFSQCINIDYYQDVVNQLNKLLDEEKLSFVERIHCINAAFKILSGQALALNIDPIRFYTHLFRIMLQISVGQKHMHAEVFTESLSYILMNHSNNITQNRLLAFLKRLFTMMLNVQHNTILGTICIARLFKQHFKITSILLDTENMGDNIYLADLNDPEYSNAGSTSLWEVVALQRYYHSSVQNIAKIIFQNAPLKMENTVAKNIIKSTPKDIYVEYDSSRGTFHPAITKPKIAKVTRLRKNDLSARFEDLPDIINSHKIFDDKYVDLFEELRHNRKIK